MITFCREPGCDASATASEVVSMRGVGTKGQDITVYYEKMHCWNGHHYMVEVLEVDSEDRSRP